MNWNSDRSHEMRFYDYLDQVETDRPGISLIRKRLGSFEIQGPHGKHTCLVLGPLGITLDEVLDYFPQRKISLGILKPSLRHILIQWTFSIPWALRILLSNFLLGVDDPALFFSFEDAEHTQPAPRKILEDRTIYVSRRMYATDGLPFLCDLGQARFPEEIGNRGAYIMPDVYRAPEITMHMKWDCSVDVWNIAMVVCVNASRDGFLFLTMSI
ncbi:hypothetical protein AJ79_08007 [Helicocarpus griseus UAMH5409]|uniref:Protein kinase domain-containing protein n=1 Tax=Helicocarpus griseus UAMH5409 TaxID=1447875 RepID=A0A2B7WWG1_9EURO|nr:hypothetical protein AJ79_08007 [Helicocarpus griseus UAMH5409]